MDAILSGFLNCLEPLHLVTMLLSVVLGVIVGALPGFGAATGLIIVLPLTYSMDSSIALVALVGVYAGAEYGGSISAILLNTPGTASAVVTAFDGFPMAHEGRPREALLYSNVASTIGGIVGGLVMLIFLPVLINFAFLFGAGEIFFMALLGLTLIGTVSNGDLPKGISSIAIGILLSTVGADATSGVPRFYFNSNSLFSGIPNIPVMLGLFSLPFLMQGIISRRPDAQQVHFPAAGMRDNARLFCRTLREVLGRMKIIVLRSSLMGILIGIIPGVGATVSTFLAYSTAKDSSPTPERFGKGAPEGIVAPESANNALVGGSLIPVLSLGIPGSPAAAVFMGAIFMHGMMPGPSFMEHEPVLVYTVVCAVIVASLLQFVLGMCGIGFLANILRVPLHFLVPAVIAVCAIGAYSMRGIGFDIELFVLFGILGFFFVRMNYSISAVMLGMILGKITEVSLVEAINISASRGGLWAYFTGRPLSIVLFAVFVVYLAYVIVSGYRRGRKSRDMAKDEASLRIPTLFQGMRRCDFGMGCLLLACGAALTPEALSYPDNSRIFPLLALGLLFAGSAAVCLRALFMPGAYAGAVDGPFASIMGPRAAVMFAFVVVYTAVMLLVGFYFSTLLFVLVMSLYIRRLRGSRLEGRMLFVRHAAFSFVYTLALWFVFSEIFLLQMPGRLTL